MATETEKMINVAIVGDTVPEADEQFTVTITSGHNWWPDFRF